MSNPEAEAVRAELGIDTPDVVGPAADLVAQAPAATPNNDPVLLRRTLEGLLFITDRPLSAAELGKLVNVRDQDRIVAVVEDMRRELEERCVGYRLIAVAEGWQMATRSELAPYVRKLFADRATMRLSTAAQETLSIIAYRQPLTRAEIETIRGVEVIAALETLLEKRLTKVVGRKETVGRPLMYGTTSEFLRHFGLRTLEDLPPLDSFIVSQPIAATEGGTMIVDAPIVEETIAIEAAAESALSEAQTAPDESKGEPGDSHWPK